MGTDARFFSRGNTAIAALLLVTFVGVGAVVIDSMGSKASPTAVSVQSQVAAAPGAAPGDQGVCIDYNDKWLCEHSSKNAKCEMGEDYIIRFVSGKDSAGKEQKVATLEKTIDGKEVNAANQCQPPATPPSIKEVPVKNYNGEPIPARKCLKDGPEQWKCYVTFCKPKGFPVAGGEALKEEKCKTIPSGAKVGEGINAQEAVSKELAGDLKKIYESGSDAQKKEAAKYFQTLPESDRKGILDAFKDDTVKQLDVINEATFKYDEATRTLENCEQTFGKGSDECFGYSKEKADANTKLEAERAKLRGLAEASQGLNNSKSVLEPPCPGEKCTTTGGITKPDDRFTKSCTEDRNQPKCNPNRFPDDGPCPGGSCNRTSPGGSNPLSSMLNPNSLLPLLSGFMSGFMQKAPTCTISASPKNASKPGDPVTLTWSSQGAMMAQLSNAGQVGPSGSMTVNPQQTTTYTMQVIGYPPQGQQQQNPYGQQYNPYGQQQYSPYGGYGGYVQQDPYCVTSIYPVVQIPGTAGPGCYNYRPPYGQQQQQQNPYSQLGQSLGQLFGGGGGGQQQAQCSTQVTVGAQGGGGEGDGKPKAQISCQPKIADVGMEVAISFACQNSAAAGGKGFSTDGKLSGSAVAKVEQPTIGTTKATYSLTCSNQGVMDSADCTVGVNKPSIVFVANPKNIKSGETSTIGWVTGAMESCIVSSPTNSKFTEDNKSNTSPSGSAKTPPLTQNTKFVVTCTTKAGGTKTAETTVEVGN